MENSLPYTQYHRDNLSSQKLHFHATLSHFSISTRKYWIYHLYTYISIATRPSTCEGLVLLVVHLGSVCGQLSQLRGVRVTTRRKGKVERGDCDDCMYDLGTRTTE